ncbi:CPBP family intramembrane glutamic endopeptidase [Terrabacter sp. NPDC080008]|uniref:CPBP family intramembrane glutamic endopeptidase n=1 Tax=Terrabacter sp. NPDC080008 TaxID=3155176 RepID=UPI00344E8029
MTPLRRALALWAAVVALIAAGGLVTLVLLPDVGGTIRALLVTLVLFAAVLVARARWWSWKQVGVTRPDLRSHLPVLAVLSAVALSPLVGGVRMPADGLVVLVTGYALTGFTEELLWRGMAQRVLAPLGPVRGVVVTAALFGASHLANVLFRESVALVVAQAWGAFCFGIAYGAVRNRLGSIVPLMVLHAVTDLAAAVGALPKIPVLVAEDVILLALGIVLLARDRRVAVEGVRRREPAVG